MSASGGISLDLTVFFLLLLLVFGTVLVQMFPILLRLQRDTCTTALILLMLRGPSPSIILYFQTEEGGASKKKLKALVFLYYNRFISYEYLV